MKDIIKDFKSENFTRRDWVIYGIIVPVVLVLVALLGSLGE